jgi:hypothetical protein
MKHTLVPGIALFACSLASLMSCEGDNNRVRLGEGEGEARGDEGEGEGEGEGEDVLVVTDTLGSYTSPTPVTLPYDEVVENSGGSEQCAVFTVTQPVIVTIRASNPACLRRLDADGGDKNTPLITVFNDEGDAGYGLGTADVCAEFIGIFLSGEHVVCVSDFFGVFDVLVPTRLTVSSSAAPEVGDVCDPAVGLCLDGRCLSIAGAAEARCTLVNDVEIGDACVPDSVTAPCNEFGRCNPDTLVCDSILDGVCESSLETATAAVLGANEVLLPTETPLFSCFTSEVVRRLTVPVTGTLTATVDNPATSIVLLGRDCSDVEQCDTPTANLLSVTAGDEVFLFINGEGDTRVRYTVSVEARLQAQDACTITPGIERCDTEAGLYCSGDAGCVEPAELELSTAVDVVATAGVQTETCYTPAGEGLFTFTTAGACSAPGTANDTQLRVVFPSGGSVINDDVSAQNRCSSVEVNLGDTSGVLVCVSPKNFDGNIEGVTLTGVVRQP